MIKYELLNSVKTVLKNATEQQSSLFLEIPANNQHGHYATNIAFRCAKEMKKNPKLIADEFCEQLNESSATNSTVSFQNLNGFINLILKESFIITHFNRLFKTETTYPVSSKSILLEFVSANPTGPLHIGHGRWAVLGSVLYNLIKSTGITVDAEFYINDAGNQIKLFYESVNAAKDGEKIPEDGYHGQYIHELASLDTDPLQANIDSHKKTLTNMGLDFDYWQSEQALRDNFSVDDVIKELDQKGLIYKEENATWFSSTKFGDEKDRVLIKADGNYTYFLVDLMYHQQKVKRGYSQLINIWGADHHGYVARVRAGLIALCGEEFKDESSFEVMIGQLVSLKRDGEPIRMSKRTGDMITFDEVLDEIGTDATRYFLIEKSPDTHLDFDLEAAKKKTMDNPVYYIQYAHARLSKIMSQNALDHTYTIPNSDKLVDIERDIMIHCLRLYETCWDSAQALAPYRLTQYAFTLAKLSHSFYEQCSINKADEAVKNRRLFIVKNVLDTLKYVLNICGISAPESM